MVGRGSSIGHERLGNPVELSQLLVSLVSVGLRTVRLALSRPSSRGLGLPGPARLSLSFGLLLRRTDDHDHVAPVLLGR